ncbi:hypothetical protein RB537 [Rhodopirellula baltica SH 1]|uniref:Uncharacterized protein n=1 Tax=Rhodopirellula baltica (strain DSM 10527 / NCIMB 13988 / SH1) TaxID=243090 RepID=Q7UYK4_RHOBA|nr:hypothetical protein RB537 [Rhodopirellula baltica SH 1]
MKCGMCGRKNEVEERVVAINRTSNVQPMGASRMVLAEWHLLHPPSGRVGPLRAGEGEPKTRCVALPSLRSALPGGG